MIITRGKHKGRSARLHQCANDWLSVDVTLDDGSSKAEILNPTAALFTDEEIVTMERQAAGTFWAKYEVLSGHDGDEQHRLRKPRR